MVKHFFYLNVTLFLIFTNNNIVSYWGYFHPNDNLKMCFLNSLLKTVHSFLSIYTDTFYTIISFKTDFVPE